MNTNKSSSMPEFAIRPVPLSSPTPVSNRLEPTVFEEQVYVPAKLESCCFRIDRNAAICVVSTFIVFFLVILSAYKLVSTHSCEDVTPYYIMLSNVGSLAAGALFSLAKVRYPPQTQRSQSMS